MQNQHKSIFVITAIILLLGCSEAGGSLCATGNKLTVPRTELRQALVMELNNEGIAFEENKSGEICYPRHKKDLVHGILIEIESRQRPSNHITIAGGAFAQQVFRSMEEAGIGFAYVEKDYEVILIVDERSKVKDSVEIIDSIANTLFPSD